MTRPILTPAAVAAINAASRAHLARLKELRLARARDMAADATSLRARLRAAAAIDLTRR